MGAFGGSTDIGPEPYQASRLARLLCKTPKMLMPSYPPSAKCRGRAVVSNLSIFQNAPKQKALLGGPNFHRYPTILELNHIRCKTG